MDFQTFCLQINEDVNYDDLFVVGSITDSADDDAGPDPISAETAWIFTSFRHGALSMFTSDEIQSAIWILEDEWTLADGLHVFGAAVIGDPEALIALAQASVNAGWVNNGVGVINLFFLDGGKAQDQLTLTEIPEPATLLLVGGGAAALMRPPPRQAPAQRLEQCRFAARGHAIMIIRTH